MIEGIIHHYIPDYENTTDKKVREQYSILGGVLGIICNLLLFIGKLAVGMGINSIAIISDAFNNLSDMGSSVISIISAKLSNRPPDKAHPFGHGRIEYLASLTIGTIIIFVGYQLCEASVEKFFNPEPIEFSYWTIIILTASIGIKGWMCLYNRYIAKTINSSVNSATASDSINDAIATTGVLIATLAQLYTSLPIDAIAGTLIGLLIIYTGFSVDREIINVLLGEAPPQELADAVRACVANSRYVVGTHDLKIHDYGPGRKFASIHAEVPDTTNWVEFHASLDDLEEEIADKYQMEINIHMDPLCTDETKLGNVRKVLDDLLHKKYPLYKTSGIRFTSGSSRLNIICDLHLPPEDITKEKKTEIMIYMDKAIRDYNSSYRVVFAQYISL